MIEHDKFKVNKEGGKLYFNYKIGCKFIKKKKRFSTPRWSKLMPREDKPFQIIEKINDNTYKVEFMCDYGAIATFNVGDDLMENVFDKWGNDLILTSITRYQIRGFVDSSCKTWSKKVKELINKPFQDTCGMIDFKRMLKNEEKTLINLCHI